MTKRELERLTDRQLWRLLARIARIFWERHGVEPWPEDAEQPEALETLTSACEEIERLISVRA